MLRMPIFPRCIQCMRQSLFDDASLLPTPFYRQLRGKKRTAKKQPRTVKVKLRDDILGYGRRGMHDMTLGCHQAADEYTHIGSIIPVAPGRMRNIWYPRQMAEYVTESQLREQRTLVAERDVTFGMDQMEENTAEEERELEEKMIDVQMNAVDVRSTVFRNAGLR